VDDPTQFLKQPGDPDTSMTNGFFNPFYAFNYISPSAWINILIEKATGVDLIGEVLDFLTGDWAAIWRFGDGLGNLAQCMQQIGINIQSGVLNLERTWHGNAADAASKCFSTLAAASSGQQQALYAAQQGYQKAATGAWELSQQLGNLVQAVVDKAILFGISVAAGTVTAETGVGAVVGYGLAAYQVVEMVKLVNKASTIINTAGTLILSLFGGGMILGGESGDLSAVPLPSAAFAPPGV
jgi:hypothetical protein